MAPIHNQPLDGPFGKVLQNEIKDEYDMLTLVSAFAKRTGVLAVADQIRAFKTSKKKVDAYIGVDLGGTTYEALVELLDIVDNLYICHDKRMNVTFHPKIYVLSNKEKAWVSIGSNNLTHSGLYRNVECCTILNLSLNEDEDLKTYTSVMDAIDHYKEEEEFCKKADKELIEELLKQHYIYKEEDKTVKTGIITIDPETKKSIFGTLSKKAKSKQSHNEPTNGNEPKSRPIEAASGFWFETGKVTGGSGNILDLSKTGTVIKGDVSNTQYRIPGKDGIMMGGVSFFGIDPSDINVEKDIIINYKGKNYVGNTIKIPTTGKKPNLSWRIQFKGVDPISGEKINHVVSIKEKILLFQEIEPDRYLMQVLEGSMIDDIIEKSEMVAANGSRTENRKYGVIEEEEDSE